MRFYESLSGVGNKLPVHGAGNDVGTAVVAPHEGSVDVLDVPRQPGVGQWSTSHGVPLTARHLPVPRT